MKEAANVISSEHRGIHPSVSKLGKTIEKSFEHELTGLLAPGFAQDGQRIDQLNRALHLYLLRHGHTISVDNFCLEANVSPDDDQVTILFINSTYI